MISKHSAHLTPLAFGIRTWLWWYSSITQRAKEFIKEKEKKTTLYERR